MAGTVIPFRKRDRTPPRRGWLEAYRHFWEQSLSRFNDYLEKLKIGETTMPLEITIPKDQPVIVMTRTLNAPRALVWKAWTEPQHVARWWGARSMGTNTLVKLDLRPGGQWRFEATGHDGSTWVFKGEYLEVDPPRKLVNTFGMEGMFEGKTLVETHSFEEVDGKTHYTSHSRFDSIEDRDGMVASGMEEGANISMDQLDELLEDLKQQ